jgi:phosphoribosylanthranilate isomerase
MLTAKRAAEVLASAGTERLRVGVFGDQTADEIFEIAGAVDLSVVQLHCDTTPDRIAALRRRYSGKIWPVCRVAGSRLPAGVDPLIAAGDGLLIDALVQGKLGGTGTTLPWSELAQEFRALRARTRPIVLAGGLRPENVARAIATLTPHVVDVSSGVERAPGIKDHDRMRAFRDAVDASFEP